MNRERSVRPEETPPESMCARAAKLPYEPPRIEQRVAIVTNTLQSGSECVFDPPPCPE